MRKIAMPDAASIPPITVKPSRFVGATAGVAGCATRTSVRQFAELRSFVRLGCGAYRPGGGGVISNPLRLAEGSRCGAAGSLID
jgi:hypothetical protein